jgi:hypothetical protein
MIPKVVPPTVISLISAKQCRKVFSHTGKFFFFLICNQSENKVETTSMASSIGLSTQHKKVDTVMEKYKYIFSSPTGVPLHYKVKHSIDMTPKHHYSIGPLSPLSVRKLGNKALDTRASRKMGTFDQSHHLVEVQSYFFKIKMGLGTGTQFPKLTISLTN